MSEIDLIKLRKPFPPSEIEWRVGATNSDKTKGIALPYITNRAVQNRLDDVCGPGNWWNEYKQFGENSQLCGITILIDGRPVTKWDGADNTKVDPTKGGLSNSMKRAAAQWGIGRYLYSLPTYWKEIKKAGGTFKLCEFPILPKWALPEGYEDKKINYSDTSARYDEANASLEEYLDNEARHSEHQITESQAMNLYDTLQPYEEQGMFTVESVWKYFGVKDAFALTNKQYAKCLQMLNGYDEKAEKSAKKK